MRYGHIDELLPDYAFRRVGFGCHARMTYEGGKGGGGSAPSPDPQIGAAALKNAALGDEWLNFAREQFDIGNVRQAEMDILTNQITSQQLDSTTKSNLRSDQQWSDYNSMYRPIERMNVLDAMGGQYMTDDQVSAYLAKDKDFQTKSLQAQHEANLAKINARAAGMEKSATNLEQAVSKVDIGGLAKQIVGAAPTVPTPKTNEKGKVNNKAKKEYKAAVAEYNKEKAAYDQRLSNATANLSGINAEDTEQRNESGGGATGATQDEINRMIEAEKARYQSELTGLDSLPEQVMLQRQAGKQAQESAAAEAKTDVLKNADLSRQMAQRNMASMGLNPNSGRFASMSRVGDLDSALASAGAQNNARNMVRTQGTAMRADQANYGRGGASVAAQQVGLGLNAGNSAVGNQGAANANFYQNSNVMSQGFGGAMQGYSNQGNMLSNLYGQQVNQWGQQQQANAASAAGAGQAVGAAAGIAAAFMM